jgi:hypothetical protein
MEQESLVVGPLIAYLDRNRLTAIRAGSLDPAIRAQCRTNPERLAQAEAQLLAPESRCRRRLAGRILARRACARTEGVGGGSAAAEERELQALWLRADARS